MQPGKVSHVGDGPYYNAVICAAAVDMEQQGTCTPRAAHGGSSSYSCNAIAMQQTVTSGQASQAIIITICRVTRMMVVFDNSTPTEQQLLCRNCMA
jgi:hypothetical protein